MLQGSQVLQGRYQLQESFGQNAGRQTWLAADVQASPPERVIVKLLAFSPQMQWEDFKLFEREAQVLKNLNHPRIPRYRDYFSLDKEAGNGLYWFALVQDYIPGKSLQQLLDEGKRFTEAQVRSLATQVLEILSHLHQLNPPVLHRDIKPSNLILGENEQVYLVDFGAVQDQAAVEGVTFTVVGTAGYAPLEQFWGKAVPASDLYSLGATLIHILTGIAPVDLPLKNLKVQFSDRLSLPPNFVRWIESLTAPDLDLRYQKATLALEDLKFGRFLNEPLQKSPTHQDSRLKVCKSPERLKIEIYGREIWLPRDLIVFCLKLILRLSFVINILGVLLLIGISISTVVLGFFSFFLNLSGAFIFLALSFMAIVSCIPIALVIFLLTSVIKKDLLSKISSKLKWLSVEPANLAISLNQKDLFIEKTLFKWSYFRHGEQVAKIKNVNLDSNKLFIEGGLFTYSFGQNLTEEERQWLVKEIREWL